ncbi:MAG: hypothetical protein ACPGJV_10450 [Bacteriovoracaceae bacterium]
MVKRFLQILILLITLGIFQSAKAQISAYAAFGPNFAGLGSARVGLGDWELGVYAPGAFALNKVFKLKRDSLYAVGGLGYFYTGTGGIVAGGGYNYEVAFRMGLRLELVAMQGFDGYSSAVGVFGASFNF